MNERKEIVTVLIIYFCYWAVITPPNNIVVGPTYELNPELLTLRSNSMMFNLPYSSIAIVTKLTIALRNEI